MAFHARLRELRERVGLTQDELARRADLSKAVIANLEQGRNKPIWETVQKLSKALGVSCEAFNEPATSDEPAPRGRPRKSDADTDAVPESEPKAASKSKDKAATRKRS